MAIDEKDRFGDKLRDMEKAREDQWAAQRDRELLEKLRQKRAEMQSESGAADKTHGLLCPHCRQSLTRAQLFGLEILTCPNGEGAWLDETALSELQSRLK